MPNSVSEGTRPSAFRMRWYSSAVMPWVASNSGVTATGSGTTAEVVVIALAFIFAWDHGALPGIANLERPCLSCEACEILLMPTPEAGMAELADAADSKSAGPCGH